METKRRRIAAIMLCLLLPVALAFAGGEKESRSQAAAETGLTAKGQILFYDTVSDYQKQTGKTIGQFNESPMLGELVKADKLPPVEQRLPKEPMVIKPLDEVGRYRGVLRTFALAPSSGKTRTETGTTRGTPFSTRWTPRAISCPTSMNCPACSSRA